MNDYVLRTSLDFLNNRFGGWEFKSIETEKSGEVVRDALELEQKHGLFEDDTDGKRRKAVMYFDARGFHAMVQFLNTVNNVVLRWSVNKSSHLFDENPLGPSDLQDYGITGYTEPIRIGLVLTPESLIAQVADTGISLIIGCAFSFVPVGYVVFVMNERLTKEKRQQLVYGVSPVVYWIIQFSWDMVMMLFPLASLAVINYLFKIDIYFYRDNYAMTISLMAAFIFSVTPLMYIAQRYFSDTATAYVVLFLTNLFLGATISTVALLLQFFGGDSKAMVDIGKFIWDYFIIIPQFALGGGFLRMAQNQMMTYIFQLFGDDKYTSPFSFGAIGWHVVSMIIVGNVAFVLLLIIEVRVFNISSNTSEKNDTPDVEEDDDVAYERQRVVVGATRSDVLTLYKLSKTFRFGLRRIRAVSNLCVSVPRGECFGLLGVNGAGKTTTFRMITGDTIPTSGIVMLNGQCITNNLQAVCQEIGYCPQFDSLDSLLTAKEMLFCYGRIKGIPDEDLGMVTDRALAKLGLERFRNKRTEGYSGGTKRKLSTAIALLGDPIVVLMDEPTTGMDPATRRSVWNTIMAVVQDNRSVVLTSHSMEECDALCTRLAIMVNGEMKCLGSPQHLKTKFSDGYMLQVRCRNSKCGTRIVQFVLKVFPGSSVKDQHHMSVEFQIVGGAVTLSHIFGSIEPHKERLGIEDYSVSQTTLDQVFVNFALKQGAHFESDSDSEDLTSWSELDDALSERTSLIKKRLDDTETPSSTGESMGNTSTEVSDVQC